MKYKIIFIFSTVIIALLFLFVFKNSQSESLTSELSTPIPTQIETTEYPINANFKIITNGITRNFSASMYKNQSEIAFIPDSDSNTVIVNQKTTWREFFDTLPFSLDEQCLITGDGDRLCSGKGGNLSFTLNNQSDPNALDKVINKSDFLLVSYE